MRWAAALAALLARASHCSHRAGIGEGRTKFASSRQGAVSGAPCARRAGTGRARAKQDGSYSAAVHRSHALLTASGKKQRPKETPGYIQVRNSRPRRGVLNEPSVQSRSHSWELSTSTRHQSVQARQRINPLIRAVEPFARLLRCARGESSTRPYKCAEAAWAGARRATGAAVPVLQHRIQ